MVVSLYGRADNYELVFMQDSNGLWGATVPPDMTDGTYAVELYAVDWAGNIGYYTGLLYMCNGMTCLRISEDEFKLKIIVDRYELHGPIDIIDCEVRRCCAL